VSGGSSVSRRSSSSSGIERAPSMCPAAYSSAGQPLQEVLAADRVDVLAKIVARRALDLRQPGRRSIAQGQPEPQRLVAGQRVAHARALSRARDHAGGPQGLQVLRRVGRRLLGRPRQVLDGPRRLGQEVQQLEPHGAGERLAHERNRLEQRVLARPVSHLQ
jgi:hypothetical protein